MAFFKEEKDFFGLDISPSSIKVVQLSPQRGGFYSLVTYGAITLPASVFYSDSQKAKRKIATSVKEIIEKAKVRAKNAVCSLPGSSVFVSVISLPPMTESELKTAVRFEAAQYIPSPLEEVNLDFKVLHQQEDHIEVLIIAAPKNLVEKYLEILNLAEINPLAIEIAPLALLRALVREDTSSLFILDIGSVGTEAIIAEDRIIKLTRNLPFGGGAVTEALAKDLKMKVEEAETYKREKGLLEKGFNRNPPPNLKRTLASLISEIKRTLEFYGTSTTTGKREAPKSIILSGGGAKLLGLTEFLTQKLDIGTIIGDPWTNITYPDVLKERLEEIGPLFALAVGLALRR